MSDIAISELNFHPEVRGQVRAKRVVICDTTLRDGELAVPSGYRLQDYIRIAHMLDDMGVTLLQISYPGLYARHKEAAAMLKPKIVIPMHFGSFPVIVERADEFVDLCHQVAPEVRVVVLEPRESTSLG